MQKIEAYRHLRLNSELAEIHRNVSHWLSGDLDLSILLEESLESGMKNKRTLGERITEL